MNRKTGMASFYPRMEFISCRTPELWIFSSKLKLFLCFNRLLSDYRKNATKTQNLDEAKRVHAKVVDLQGRETMRQMGNMKYA